MRSTNPGGKMKGSTWLMIISVFTPLVLAAIAARFRRPLFVALFVLIAFVVALRYKNIDRWAEW